MNTDEQSVSRVAHVDGATEQAADDGLTTRKDKERRAALKAALAAGPVLLSLRGQRAWAQGGGGSVAKSIAQGTSLHQA